QQPQADHGMHPPILRRKKAVPQIQPIEHVEAAEPGERRRQPCLPGETPLDHVEERDPFLGRLEAPDGGQQHGRHHGDAADPEDDCENVDRARYGYVVHGCSSNERAIDFMTSASWAISTTAASSRAAPSSSTQAMTD